jgi:hypothetical protein
MAEYWRGGIYAHQQGLENDHNFPPSRSGIRKLLADHFRISHIWQETEVLRNTPRRLCVSLTPSPSD